VRRGVSNFTMAEALMINRVIGSFLLLLSLFVVSTTPARAVTNPLSSFTISVDGQFSGGVSGGAIQGEWSDISPLAFISPPTPSGQLLQVAVGDARANSLLYAAVAPGVAVTGHELYLMYDYLPRTNAAFAPGDFIADIRFPIQPSPSAACPSCNGLTRFDATVEFRGASPTPANGFANFDVSVNVPALGGLFPANAFDMDGAIGFGPSTLSNQNHLLVELEVGLNTPPGFFGPGSQKDNGTYSPDPAFWGADVTKDAGDPPASAAMFQINPGGSILINGTAPFVPEPSTICLLLMGVASAVAFRRASRRKS
jgi:PEP-CTERM motif